jgi:hypothetical protein
VPGVRVQVKGARTTVVATDARGRFALADETPSRLRVEVEHPELFRHPMPDWIDQGAPGVAEVTVRAVRGEPHDLQVLGDGDAAVSGATVRYGFQWPEPVAGRAGRFEYAVTCDVAGVARVLVVPGTELYARIAAAGFPGGELRALAGLLPQRLEARLYARSPSEWLPLRCRDGATGADRTPSHVLVRRHDEPWIVGEVRRPAPEPATCHPDGTPDPARDFAVVDLRALPAGRWDVWVWAPGCAPAVAVADATLEGVYPPPDLRLAPGPGPLVVRTVDAETGAPIAEAHVDAGAAGSDGFLHAARFRLAAKTDAEGRVSFELPPGAYTVSVAAKGYAAATAAVTHAPGAGEARVALRAAAE